MTLICATLQGDSLSCEPGDVDEDGDEDDGDEDDGDEQRSGTINEGTKAKTLPQTADPMMQGACGMSLDGPAPTATADMVAPPEDDDGAEGHEQDHDDCLVHVDDDDGVDYILPPYYAPIVSQGVNMMPPDLAVWSGFAPQKSGATHTSLCDAPEDAAEGFQDDDWLDCLKTGDNAGLGAFEDSVHVFNQALVSLDGAFGQ